jgi:hypothetical protein
VSPESSLVNFGQNANRKNSTHLQPVRNGSQSVNCIPGLAEDAEYFQPKQKFALEELGENGCDFDRVG